jgi:hypothetical protein
MGMPWALFTLLPGETKVIFTTFPAGRRGVACKTIGQPEALAL